MKKEFEVLDLIIYVLWALIIGFILLNLCFDFQNFILVGLAALLASATVIKNIENTNKIEKEKVKRELFKQRAEIIFAIEDMRAKIQTNFILQEDIEYKFVKATIEKIIYSEYIFKKEDFEYIKPILEVLISYDNIENMGNLGFISSSDINKERVEFNKKLLVVSENISTNLKDSIKLV